MNTLYVIGRREWSLEVASHRLKGLTVLFVARYGVFDDQGYPGDRLYPDHYVMDGHILPTGTTNSR